MRTKPSPDLTEEESPVLRVPSSERLLITDMERLPAGALWCTSLGRAQFAIAFAMKHPRCQVGCLFLDQYAAEETRTSLTKLPANLSILSATDFPEKPVQCVVIPVSRGGEAELVRDLLQTGYERLETGGMLATAVDNSKDDWLHEEMNKLFKKVTRIESRWGVVYLGTKQGALKRPRLFDCEFAFRDRGHLVQAVSRPGVFSHRRLDLGARALLESMEVSPHDKVLDMGCGSGVVGLAAGCRESTAWVHFVDSNARALQCAYTGAELNGLTRVSFEQTATGEIEEAGTFNLVLGNPPYYSHYRIAEIFLQAGRLALKSGGRIQIVGKHSEWLEARMKQLFKNVRMHECRGYNIATAESKAT